MVPSTVRSGFCESRALENAWTWLGLGGPSIPCGSEAVRFSWQIWEEAQDENMQDSSSSKEEIKGCKNV